MFRTPRLLTAARGVTFVPWLALGAFGLICAVLPRSAHAGPQLEQALAAYDCVEYAEAVRLLEGALKTEALTPTELERAYAVFGSSLLGDGQADRAERAYRTLIALRPDYRPEPNAPPKVVDALRRVRAQVGAVQPKIVPDPLPTSSSDVIVVHADMTAAAPLQPAIEYRLGDSSAAPSRVRLSCNGTRCETKLPPLTESYRLGFLTEEGAFALATSDVKIAPHAAVVPKKKTPVYKKWWLWTVVGVVVVGGVVAGTTAGVLSYRASHSIEFTTINACGGGAKCALFTP